jgi:uncharacterized membrane protein
VRGRAGIGSRRDTSFWLIPAAFLLAGIGLAILLPLADEATERDPYITYSSDAAIEVLSAIAAGMIAFTGFVFAIVILLVQFGSSQYSPRLLRSFIGDPVPKIAIGTFVATFTYSLLVLSGIGTESEPGFVPHLSVSVAILLVAASVFVFLWLINHVYQQLRVGNVVRRVGREGRLAIDAIYPDPIRDEEAESWSAAVEDLGEPTEVVEHVGDQGILQLAHRERLVALATDSGSVIVLVPAIGDSVPSGAPLFWLFGDRRPDADELRAALEFGVERTIAGDPAQAVRWLVDIAIKALSPAVNDPSTALQAIDQIEDLLRRASGRRIAAGELHDASGALRLVFRRPSWDDFLDLALTEIRRDGADSVQVQRRLRAVLLDLLEVAHPGRAPALEAQLARLEETARRTFAADDLAVAEVPDYQGIGSRRIAGRRRRSGGG